MPYGGIDQIEAICVAARDLALAEKTGLDLVTPCNACYVVLAKANETIRERPEVKGIVDQALAVADLQYNGTVKVRHFMEVLYNDITPEGIAAKVTRRLTGLKVASYYGCQMVRPGFGFDNTEMPTSLDEIVKALGAEPTPFDLKTTCCGGSLIISEQNRVAGLIGNILSNALEGGAQCIVTPCPLCQTNLDVYQDKASQVARKDLSLPVLFVAQLVGVAFALNEEELGLKSNVVPTERVLQPYRQPVMTKV
jgi:heterodisulfide reductase subunit B